MAEARIRLKYKPTLNYQALKEQEGQTLSSFLELVNRVILIDETPFSKATYTNSKGITANYKLTTGRKTDFLRIIERHAILEFIGMKCYVVKVFGEKEQNIVEDTHLQKYVEKIKHS